MPKGTFPWLFTVIFHIERNRDTIMFFLHRIKQQYSFAGEGLWTNTLTNRKKKNCFFFFFNWDEVSAAEVRKTEYLLNIDGKLSDSVVKKKRNTHARIVLLLSRTPICKPHKNRRTISEKRVCKGGCKNRNYRWVKNVCKRQTRCQFHQRFRALFS